MDMTPIETALKTWVRQGTGLDYVVMVDEAREPVVLTGWAVIEFVNVTPIGTDCVRVKPDTGAVVTYGSRHATVRVASECFYQDPDVNALVPLTQLVDRILWPSQMNVFRVLGMAYVDRLEIANQDYEVDQRLISRFAFDMRIAFPFREEYVPPVPPIEDDPNLVPAIATLDVTSRLKDAGGVTQIPTPPQLDHELIDLENPP